MTLNEITTAITAMPIDSTIDLLCLVVTRVEEDIFVVDNLYYSTALQAAAAVQDLA